MWEIPRCYSGSVSFHKKGPICEGCNLLLLHVHTDLVMFFRWAKEKYPDVHIAEGWRGEEDQNKDFAEGKSKLQWPNSKHNHMEQGHPCSLALDLFLITPEGKADFNRDFYDRLYQDILKTGFNIRWGGTFKDFYDGPHYEINQERKSYAS